MPNKFQHPPHGHDTKNILAQVALKYSLRSAPTVVSGTRSAVREINHSCNISGMINVLPSNNA